MPQFDFSQAMPQLVWLAVIFGVLYLVVQALYPRIERVMVSRQERIASDLREAEAARDAARAVSQQGTSGLAEVRSKAVALTGKARDEAAATTAAKVATAEQQLRAQAESAAAELARQRAAAEVELDRVAATAAAQLVERLTGIEVAAADAAAAVGKAAV